MTSKLLPLAAALLAFAAGTAAHADDVGQHPAVFSPRSLPGVDASTFIVGHPASPSVRGGRANSPHPADAIAARRDEPTTINPDTYVVQPPAAVHWVAKAG